MAKISSGSRPVHKSSGPSRRKPFSSASLRFSRPKKNANPNAIGFAKRQERKERNREATDITDVYEYSTGRNKRSNVDLTLDREEAHGADELDTTGDDTELIERIRRSMADGDDDQEVNSDDDEEIESDDAFEESDKERFTAFKFKDNKGSKQKSSNKSQPSRNVSFQTEVDLREDENEDEGNGDKDEDEEEGDIMDLSRILEKGPESDSDGVSESGSQDYVDIEEEAEEEGDEEDEDEEDEEEKADQSDSDPLISEDEEDEDALSKLDNFIGTLETKKRKVGNSESNADRPSRRRRLVERTELGNEGEFAAPAGSGDGKLRIEDLLAPLTNNASSSSSLTALKKSAKLLSSKSDPLPAPIPQRTQDRLNREAAYEQTKEEVQKWAPTMKRIREAEHLSFPLQAKPAAKPSSAGLAAQFKPSNELENAVDKLLKSAKMREEDLVKSEELKMKDLSPEEVAARRAELQQMRELMFRAETKAKRVAKIKSKTYRRIQKKERQKNNLDLNKLDQLDPEAAEAERMKMEAERAKERATMRHKNKGKWAKSMLARGELDIDQRREINEQLERGELLRKKIQGVNSDEESDHDSDEDEGVEDIKARAFDELASVQKEGLEIAGKKGLFEMKFMKDALAREQRQGNRLIDDFKSELRRLGDEDGDRTSIEDRSPAPQVMGGRMSFRPGTANTPIGLIQPSRGLISTASDISSTTLKSSEPERSPRMSPLASIDFPPPETSNPWLVQPSELSSKVSRKKNNVVVGKNSASAEKSKNILKKQLKKTDEARDREREDATVEISMDDFLTVSEPKEVDAGPKTQISEHHKTPTAKKKSVAGPALENSADEGSEAEELAQGTKGAKAFQQRELVALAFAGDNVVEEFAQQKKREIEADAPKEVDTTLPGWGSWGGQGAKKTAPNRHLIKTIPGIDPTKRADYGKSHVIISEKKDKKASKYLVKDLPYPYTSKAQFEKSLAVPLGTEWNTRIGFQKGTLPRIVKKMGVPIEPLEKVI